MVLSAYVTEIKDRTNAISYLRVTLLEHYSKVDVLKQRVER